ncbi:MAG: LacI family DNA-binding transcriptional regulator [Phycisphaeraceae bacterium JB051]
MASVTLKDIARKAGVSAMTVSASLHGTGRVSAQKSAKIKKIARQMGYQPRVAAQLLSRKRSGQVGLLMTYSPNMSKEDVPEAGYAAPILASFVQTCEVNKLPYHIEYYMAKHDHEAFMPPRQLAGGLVDGAVVVGHPDEMLADWLNHHCQSPLVYIDEPGEYAVHSAVDQGIYQAVTELAAMGHRRIAYIGGPSHYMTHAIGYEGFAKAVKAYSLNTTQADIIETTSADMNESARQYQQIITSWFKSKQRPTAVVVHSAVIARVLIGLLLERGISIPKQMSLIAVAAHGDCKRTYPLLSGIEADYNAMLDASLGMLKQLVDQETLSQKQVHIMPRIELRDTVCPPANV